MTFTETKLDVDNGVTVYEVEFRTDEAEYEYEIDAVNGSIFEYETEGVDSVGFGTSESGGTRAYPIDRAERGPYPARRLESPFQAARKRRGRVSARGALGQACRYCE